MDLYFGDLETRKIDIARAKKQHSVRGDPLIAPAGSNYPEGQIVDYFCLVCGNVMCAHGEDNNCWLEIMPRWKVWLYELCKRIMWWIERS
jgi:hypothetical protein